MSAAGLAPDFALPASLSLLIAFTIILIAASLIVVSSGSNIGTLAGQGLQDVRQLLQRLWVLSTGIFMDAFLPSRWINRVDFTQPPLVLPAYECMAA